MQSEVRIKEWNIIETKEDIDNLLSASFGFHDTIVKKIYSNEEEQLVEVTFDTTLGCNIIVRFENEVEFMCEEGYGNIGEIIGASIFLEDGFVYWVDTAVESSKDIEQDYCFIKSRKVTWKMEIK